MNQRINPDFLVYPLTNNFVKSNLDALTLEQIIPSPSKRGVGERSVTLTFFGTRYQDLNY